MSFELTRTGAVFVLRMDDGENRFNEASLSLLNSMLDEVEGATGAASLVTVGSGKFYSNGLDLDWVMRNDATMSLGELASQAQRLMARTLVFPRPTVAAINGHCFAAGAMWSLAHDIRIMRRDRGFWSLPEVDIRIPFTDGMGALIQGRLDPQAAHLAMTTGHRFGGEDAAAQGIVDRAESESELLQQAITVAAGLADKDPITLGAIKQGMYGQIVTKLTPG